MPFAELGYWLSNFILYWMLVPFAIAGYMIWITVFEPWSDRRTSREKAGERPTLADRVANLFSYALPWAVAGTVLLFELTIVATIAYVIISTEF
jgi:hypothetical protein